MPYQDTDMKAIAKQLVTITDLLLEIDVKVTNVFNLLLKQSKK